ncbi:ribonuclease H-like domain-containing protein [Artemisia annua]|uniref:Ribonuclease H-like domain-containing protein n=1 Tax=Artemisia annua TaxID=35608 RepID=A0A2U1PD14_ARTAN|nr:ribonuclease H-like domain-containing protein [Artemisia annua]
MDILLIDVLNLLAILLLFKRKMRENESVKEPVEQIPKSSEGIYQPPHEGSSDDVSQDDVVHPDITVDVNSGGEENATLEEKDKLSEGDDDYYQEFNEMFHDVVITPVVTPDRQANMRTYTRKSSRKTSQPVKLSDYVLDNKVKYSIDKTVNYSHLSRENFVFSTNLNKIVNKKSRD